MWLRDYYRDVFAEMIELDNFIYQPYLQDDYEYQIKE